MYYVIASLVRRLLALSSLDPTLDTMHAVLLAIPVALLPAQLLADYMEMMLKMVSYQLPDRQCQYDFLKESIAELLTDLAKGHDSKVKRGQAGEERSFMANRLALR